MNESEGLGSQTPGQPPGIGALGHEIVRVLRPPTIAVIVIVPAVAIAVIAFGLSEAVFDVAPRVGYFVAVWMFAVGAAIVFTLAVIACAFLPTLLLRGDDRTAIATESWIGARETRRAFGRSAKVVSALGTPAAAAKWLTTAPSTDELRQVRVEALVLIGRMEEARVEADTMPERTPIEAYRRLEAQQLVAEQTGLPFDEPGLRDAIARIPPGVERTEAAASLAVTLARRALPNGNWRKPLMDVRPMIPESDFVLLTRDSGSIFFDILMRRVLLPFLVVFFVLATVLSVAPSLF